MMKMILLADQRSIGLSDMEWKRAKAEVADLTMTGVAKTAEVAGLITGTTEVDLTLTRVTEAMEAETVEVDLTDEMLERVDMACGDRERLV
jgi:hypothetical protein